jgi:chemosensory pili system protein ChpC
MNARPQGRDSQSLYSLLIPLDRMRLMVPRDCVVEVIGWDAARHARADGEGSWQVGEVDWEGRRVPVVSFERLCGLETALPVQRARVVLLRCLNGQHPSGYYGVVTRGFPQLVRVNPAVLAAADERSWPDDAPVLCELHMVGQSPVIPDLDQVERVLAASA